MARSAYMLEKIAYSCLAWLPIAYGKCLKVKLTQTSCPFSKSRSQHMSAVSNWWLLKIADNSMRASLRIIKSELSANTTQKKSASGPVAISHCSPDGKYVALENSGTKVDLQTLNFRFFYISFSKAVFIHLCIHHTCIHSCLHACMMHPSNSPPIHPSTISSIHLSIS